MITNKSLNWHIDHKPKSRVLVVDDIEENIYTVSRALKSMDNITIDSATSGEEALCMILQNQYALVILDVQMPGMDGFEVAEHIRSNPETQCLPIIFVTAISKENHHVHQGYEVGAIDYLFKPINKYILYNKVKAFVELHVQSQKLERSKHDIEKVLNSMGECIVSTDNHFSIQYLNNTASNLFFKEMSIQNNDFFKALKFFKHNTSDELNQEIEKAFAKCDDEIEYGIIDLINQSGEKYCVCLHAKALFDLNNQRVGILLTIQDVTEATRLNDDLRYSATHDKLTNLYNRYFFVDKLNELFNSQIHTEANYAVYFIDLDEFKRINDTFGHEYGDQILIHISKTIQQIAGEHIELCRFGGDEFVFLMHGPITIERMNHLAKKLIRTINEPIKIEDSEFYLGASIGISLYPANGIDATSLIRHADLAMYYAKQLGKNNYQYYRDTMENLATNQVKISTEIKKALNKKEFIVFYQPKVDFATQKIAGCEALIRWQDPEKGMISPNEFIPIAEECGLVGKLDLFVFEKACQELKKLYDQGYDISLSVNITPKELLHKKYQQALIKIPEKYNIKPEKIVLEITERTFIEQDKDILKHLYELKKMNFKIAIDDFGTGYSCLSYLSSLPVDIIKIDKVFVDQIYTTSHGLDIVKAITHLSNHLKKEIIVEGVETKKQVHCLTELGCQYYQGYYFSKPVDFNQFSELMQNPAGVFVH